MMRNLNLQALYWGMIGLLVLIFGCQREAIQAYAPIENALQSKTLNP